MPPANSRPFLSGDNKNAPSVWMYSPHYPGELFLIAGKWQHTLKQHGFCLLTARKVRPKLRQLYAASDHVNRNTFRADANAWLEENGYPGRLTRWSLDTLFTSGAHITVTREMIHSLAAALHVRPVDLFSVRTHTDGIGVYRCTISVGSAHRTQIYVAISQLAAEHRCLLDLIYTAPESAPVTPWHYATIQCHTLSTWAGAVPLQEFTPWLGPIGMKLKGLENDKQPLPRKDAAPS